MKWQWVSYQQVVPENKNRVIIFGGDTSNDFYIADLCITNSDYMMDYYPSLDDLTIGLLSKIRRDGSTSYFLLEQLIMVLCLSQ